MAIVKWEPLKDFVTLQDRMNQFLSDTLNNYDMENGRLVQDWVPAVDVYEDAEAIQLKAELPGMEMKEIEVRIENNALEIRGRKRSSKRRRKRTTTGSNGCSDASPARSGFRTRSRRIRSKRNMTGAF
ncbi:MAG: Hsp20 family protein [Candidatus Manganitrophus sp.]|nr:MAG: Hsp20 family protein [Candidatus Manganitrophus sp.]